MLTDFIDYYLKACKVLESCKNPQQMLVALNYIKLLKKKFPKEEAIDNLINILTDNLTNQLKSIVE